MVLETAMLWSLAKSCQNVIEPEIVMRLINNESSGKPFSIGIQGLPSFDQPTNKKDAISSIKSLRKMGFNYSVGLMQVNHTNFKFAGLTHETAFNYCENIEGGAKLFKDCYDRASTKFEGKSKKFILDSAASCYYSGNFTYGFKKEGKSQLSYVENFNRNLKTASSSIPATGSSSQITKKEIKSKPQKKENVHSWDVFRDFSY